MCIIFTLLLQNVHVLLTVLTEHKIETFYTFSTKAEMYLLILHEKYYAEMLFQEGVPTSKVGAKTYYFGHFPTSKTA